VQDVGARCTRIRRADGADLFVPISRLLKNTEEQQGPARRYVGRARRGAQGLVKAREAAFACGSDKAIE